MLNPVVLNAVRAALTNLAWAPALLLAAISPAAAQPPAGNPTPPRAQRPNILYIMADDHACNAVSAYGSVINQTPNIDHLAQGGMRFTNCFCDNSLCAPSRATILTGTISCVNGVVDLKTKLAPSKTTFPMLMQKAGYQTSLIGKWHLQRTPSEFDHWEIFQGQGTYLDPVILTPGGRTKEKGYSTEIVTDKCMKWLDERDPTRPFLLLCHYNAPHRPWIPDEKHAGMYEDLEVPEPSTFDDDYATRSDAARQQKMTIEHQLTHTDLKVDPPKDLSPPELKKWKYERFIKDYLRCVASVDDNVGRLMKYLDDHGLADNTIVIYTSDQGFFLGDHGWFDKRFMYEESLRMPLIVRYPGHIAAGSTSDRFVQNVDFGQTILDEAGIGAAAGMQGVSFKPLLEGKPVESWRDAIYYHYYEEGTEHHVAAHYGVRTERYKLIRFYSEVKAWELYDLKKDPHELNNVYDDPAYAAVRVELEAKLKKLREQYGDTTEETPSPPKTTTDPQHGETPRVPR
jgi:arylsulfatase A-like enzyme